MDWPSHKFVCAKQTEICMKTTQKRMRSDYKTSFEKLKTIQKTANKQTHASENPSFDPETTQSKGSYKQYRRGTDCDENIGPKMKMEYSTSKAIKLVEEKSDSVTNNRGIEKNGSGINSCREEKGGSNTIACGEVKDGPVTNARGTGTGGMVTNDCAERGGLGTNACDVENRYSGTNTYGEENCASGANLCRRCGSQDCFQKCSRCLAVFYCSKECQQKDWPTHRGSCTKVLISLIYLF